jgi:hypothetical protein
MMQITYAEPQWGALVFLVVAIFLLYWNLENFRKACANRFGTLENIQKVSFLRSRRFFWFRVLCLATASLFAIFALMQPVELIEQEVAQEEVAIAKEKENVDELVFIIDVSASMTAQDASEYDTRLERAKEITAAVVEHLGGIHISLYAFAGDAQNIVPATMDYLYFRILLSTLQINENQVPGTNFSALIDEMKAKYLESKIEKKVRFIVLTDGEDTGLIDLPQDVKTQAEMKLAQRLKEFTQHNFSWDIVGIGSDKAAVIPNVYQDSKPVFSTMQPAFIQMLAEAGDGHSYFDNTFSLSRIVDGLLANVSRSERKKSGIINDEPNKSFLEYPLVVAILFLMIALVVPEKVKRR